MKCVNYCNGYHTNVEKAIEEFGRIGVFSKLFEKYELARNEQSAAYSRISRPLKEILYQTDCKLENKKILDLGSGCCPPLDFLGRNKRTFEPWLCRTLNLIGAHPIGIDIGNLDKEEFEHYSLNLLDKNSLAFIPNKSIEIIHSRLLYSSPTLMDKYGFEKLYPDYLFPQLKRIAKSNGVYIFSDVN